MRVAARNLLGMVVPIVGGIAGAFVQLIWGWLVQTSYQALIGWVRAGASRPPFGSIWRAVNNFSSSVKADLLQGVQRKGIPLIGRELVEARSLAIILIEARGFDFVPPQPATSLRV